MTARELITPRVLGVGTLSLNSASAQTIDFGTPDDLKLVGGFANYKPGDRVVAVFTASTAGTTNTVTFSVQDAPDNNGSIGTPATAVTAGTLATGTGNQACSVGVQIQPGRPWLRFRAQGNGTTDTWVVRCTVLALPRAGY